MTRAPGILLALLASIMTTEAASATHQNQKMVTVVHLHTALVDGASTPVDLARAARAAGVDALLITDHLLERVSYAPWPIGSVMGVALSRPSILRDGVARHFEALRRAEAAVPGLVIVPGAEVTPYARWSGSLLSRSLTLHGWHRHALITGIDDPGRLARLPVVGNRAGGVYALGSLAYAIPVAILVWAGFRIARPGIREVRLAAFRIRRRRIPWVGLAAGGAALAGLVAGFPFRVERFSPVGSDPGVEPFRVFTRAVRDAGGVMIWAHPEAGSVEEMRGVQVRTEPYPDLVRATEAPIFAALPEGTERLLPAGGIWDQALRDYLTGRRPHPLFALAELDDHRAAGVIDFRLLQTIFLVRERSRDGILEALRAGRFYGRWTPRDARPLDLETWSVTRPARDGRAEAVAISGETLAASGQVLVRYDVSGGGPPVEVRLVRDGTPVWHRRLTPPFSESVWAEVRDATSLRLDVEGPYPYRLIANPIFVVPEAAG